MVKKLQEIFFFEMFFQIYLCDASENMRHVPGVLFQKNGIAEKYPLNLIRVIPAKGGCTLSICLLFVGLSYLTF